MVVNLMRMVSDMLVIVRARVAYELSLMLDLSVAQAVLTEVN